MTTPTTPAAAVSLRFRKKPVVIEASQWFKNGDHPLDYSRTHQGLENGQLRDFQPQERQANAWEGDIVRYYRTPSLDGKQACKHCGKITHEHGWIDTLEGGHIVCPGDWIITGVAGEHYPCKPDIFAKTYEPAELATAGESALIAERDALRTQALTAPNLACKSAQARLATQWGYVRAASVEPVGKIINSGGNTGSLPEHPAPSPAQAVDAVDAVDELREALRGLLASGGVIADASPDELQAALSDPESEPIVKTQAAAVLRARAALQASRQPQAQQAVAEGAGDGLRQTLIDVGRVIAWQCFGDCRAYDEFGPGSLRGLHEMDAEIRAALATKEPK